MLPLIQIRYLGKEEKGIKERVIFSFSHFLEIQKGPSPNRTTQATNVLQDYKFLWRRRSIIIKT